MVRLLPTYISKLSNGEKGGNLRESHQTYDLISEEEELNM
jgi:hypothetical protein